MTRDEAVARCDELLARGVEAWVLHSVSGERVYPHKAVESQKRLVATSVRIQITDTAQYKQTDAETASFHEYATFKDKIRTEGQSMQATIGFDYINSNGMHSHRRVQVKAVYPLTNETHLLGFCELRGEERTFVLLKMLNVRDSKGNMFANGREWLRDTDGA